MMLPDTDNPPEFIPHELIFSASDDMTINAKGGAIYQELSNPTELDITYFGEVEKIVIASLISNGKKCKWVYVKNEWYEVPLNGFSMDYNQANGYDMHSMGKDKIQPINLKEYPKDRQVVESIEFIPVLQVFGSHYKLVERRGRLYKVYFPHP